MKKEEFLKELEQRLDILNDNEKSDIIAEYSQHIDLKIENGLSEEAAARDFGDVKVLADEILSAYNVNLKYNKCKTEGSLKQNFFKMLKGAWNFLLKTGNRYTGFVKKCANAILLFCTSQLSKMKRFFSKVKNRIGEKKGEGDSRKEIELAEEVQEEDILDTKEGESDMEREQITPISRRAHHGFMKRGISAFCSFSKRFFWWCIRCIIWLTALPFIASGLMALLTIGIIIVLIPQGYPVIGIAIITLGFIMATASTSCILLSYCRKEKSENVIDITDIEEVQE